MSLRGLLPIGRILALAAVITAAAGCAKRGTHCHRAAPPADPTVAARLAANPDDVEARLALAEARRRAGDRAGALVEVYKALAVDSRSKEAQIERARIYFDRGLSAKEIEAWRAALEIAPDDVSVRENLGHALLAAGRNDEASAEYRRVLAAKPDATAALYNLARLETDAGHTAEARALWTRYLQTESTGPWADKARAALTELEAHR